jgi:hypothetical protein
MSPFFDVVQAMVAAGSLAIVLGTMLYVTLRSSHD